MSFTVAEDGSVRVSDGRPMNVSVLRPHDLRAIPNLQQATIFTRIQTRHTYEEVKSVLDRTDTVQQTFCISHLGVILVLDTTQATHVDHVQDVLSMLQDNSMYADPAGCVFCASNAAAAGFEFQYVGTGPRRSVMIIDLDRPAAPYF